MSTQNKLMLLCLMGPVFGCQQKKTDPMQLQNESSIPLAAPAQASIHFVNDSLIGTEALHFDFQGSWHYGEQGNAYQQDNHWAKNSSDSYAVRFEGRQIAIYAATAPNHGYALFSIDDGPATRINLYSETRIDDVLVFLSPQLEAGFHSLKVQASGEKDPLSQDSWISADRAVIFRDPTPLLPIREASYQDLNNAVLGYRFPSQTGQAWAIDIGLHTHHVYTEAAVKGTAAKYGGISDTFNASPWTPSTFEWDYTFHHSPNLGYPRIPRDRQDAYMMLQEAFLQRLQEARALTPYPYVVSGHYPYAHYAAKWGGPELETIHSEIGENIRSANAKLAFTRGAARQYGKAWGLQFSPWYGGGVLDYSSEPVWVNGEGVALSGATHGHSLELSKRIFFLTYMGGANIASMEAASINWFHGEGKDDNGLFSLSPLGEVGKNFYDVTQRFKERGIPYTPIGLVINEHHGLGMENDQIFHGLAADETGQKIKFGLKINEADEMSLALLNTLWPHSFEDAPWDESSYFLDNAPYGDIADVLTEDLSSDIMKQYPVLILSGDIRMSAMLAEKLIAYVADGGTLVLNSAYIQEDLEKTLLQPAATPLITAKSPTDDSSVNLATIHSYAAGRVIVTAPRFLKDRDIWRHLLALIQEDVLPFAIDGDIQYLFNKSAEGWIITLINNRGVTKAPFTPAVVDYRQRQKVSLLYRGGKSRVTRVWEELEGSDIPLDEAGQFSVSVPPGDVRILRISLAP